MGKQPLANYTRIAGWRELVGVDKRSAALFRFCLGAICFVDCMNRLHDAREFYSGMRGGDIRRDKGE